MTGQGFLFKAFSAIGSYRSVLTNRVPVVGYRRAADTGKSAREQLEEVNLPEKPKKPLSVYFRFMASRRDELIKENPNIKFLEVTTKLGQEWKDVSEEIKEKYREQYKVEMVEYMKKHLDYVAKLTEEQKVLLKTAVKERKQEKERRLLKKANKQSGKPKGIRNPFAFYVQEKSKTMKMPGMELIKTLRKSWETLDEKEKQKYLQLSEDDKKRHELEINAWEERMIRDGNTGLVRQSSLLSPKPKPKLPLKKPKKSQE